MKKKIIDYIKSKDKYGVATSWKSDKYQTMIGALLTLLSKGILLYWLIKNSISMMAGSLDTLT